MVWLFSVKKLNVFFYNVILIDGIYRDELDVISYIFFWFLWGYVNFGIMLVFNKRWFFLFCDEFNKFFK